MSRIGLDAYLREILLQNAASLGGAPIVKLTFMKCGVGASYAVL